MSARIALAILLVAAAVALALLAASMGRPILMAPSVAASVAALALTCRDPL